MEPLSFASPQFLAGLALIPVVVVLYVRAERRPQSFAPAHLLPSVAPRRAGRRLRFGLPQLLRHLRIAQLLII